jgi:hypothetical protein
MECISQLLTHNSNGLKQGIRDRVQVHTLGANSPGPVITYPLPSGPQSTGSRVYMSIKRKRSRLLSHWGLRVFRKGAIASVHVGA